MLRVARFLHGYARPRSNRIVSGDVAISLAGRDVPASCIRPSGTAPLPGWIVLHGITVAGRRHAALTRFANALAASGAVVLIPDIPTWRRLQLDSAAGHATIAAAVAYLRNRTDVLPGRLKLMGFSFGATQALMSATRPGVQEAVGAVIGFGGYCDLGRTLRCMISGEHEWNGVRYALDPDPYGRWIVAGNFLRRIPEYAQMHELEHAARDLAAEAGRVGQYAWSSVYDACKAQLRSRLPPNQQAIWDLIAPPAVASRPIEATRELAEQFAAAATAQEVGLNPRPFLDRIDHQKIVLAHGHGDRLIPFTESLRLFAHLRSDLDASVTITRLFAHSREAHGLRFLAYPREVGRYLALLKRALAEECQVE